MIGRVKVGDVVVYGVTDGVEMHPLSHLYRNLSEDATARYRRFLDEEGRVAMNYGSFVIRAEGRTLLIDTGWGPGVPYFGEPHGGLLLEEMGEAGIRPEEVDLVAFTHLHVDHVGWNVSRDGSRRPVFPNARYLVPEADWEFFGAGKSQEQAPERGVNRDTSFEDQLLPLKELGLVDYIPYESPLSPSVTAILTPGHTPGHTSFRVESGGQTAWILGDVAITAVDAFDMDLENHYDEDRAAAGVTRKAVLPALAQGGTLIGAAHFLRPGFGRLEEEGGALVWRGVR